MKDVHVVCARSIVLHPSLLMGALQCANTSEGVKSLRFVGWAQAYVAPTQEGSRARALQLCISAHLANHTILVVKQVCQNSLLAGI